MSLKPIGPFVPNRVEMPDNVREYLEGLAQGPLTVSSGKSPRCLVPVRRSGIALYEDDFPTRAERGTRQNRFIEPEGK